MTQISLINFNSANGDRLMIKKFSPSALSILDISPIGKPSGYLPPNQDVTTTSPIFASEFGGIDLISRLFISPVP